MTQGRGPKCIGVLRIRCLGRAPASLQDLDIEEAQRRKPLRHGVRRQPPPGEQGGLVLANVLQPQPVGRTMEVPREVRRLQDCIAAKLPSPDHHLCLHISHTIHHNLSTFCAEKSAPQDPVNADTNGERSQQNRKYTAKHHNSPQIPRITFSHSRLVQPILLTLITSGKHPHTPPTFPT
jgi:hypothetical protein